MVNNFLLRCDVCKSVIHVRYQVSEEDCPIDYECPQCKTHITGNIKTVYHYGKEKIETIPWHYEYNFNNATETDEQDNVQYVLELSPDFPVSNLIPKGTEYVPTPFMRHVMGIGIKNLKDDSRYDEFLLNWKRNWNDIKINLDLCRNKKYNILLSRYKKSYSELFSEDINAIITNHQNFIAFCVPILPKKILLKYLGMADSIYSIYKTQKDEFDLFISVFGFDRIEEDERKLIQLITFFLDLYPKFLPVFKYNSYNKKKENTTLSTLTFEIIKSFYQDAYELILEMVPEVIGLNNIFNRQKLNKFTKVESNFQNIIDSYSSKYNRYKDLLDKKDQFSWIINDNVQNHIRNSIGHFNYRVNEEKQTVSFVDKHKGKEKTNEVPLIDISQNCIYMFFTLMNLLELNYNFLKLQNIQEKQNPMK